MRTEIRFQFDRPNATFFSGEILHGCIFLKTSEDQEVIGVHITFLGEAKVLWSESDRYATIEYTGLQIFVNAKTTVFEEGILPMGTHVYTFDISIPETCLTSCTGLYGHITYKVMLVIQNSHKSEEVFTEYVTVIQPLDLNLGSEYWLPLHHEHLKSICCWPCRQGEIYTICTIPFGGFAPGQEILYQIELHNRSTGLNLSGYEVQLVQKMIFESEEPKDRNVYQQIMNSTKKSVPILPDSFKKFVGKIAIPPMPPSSRLSQQSIIHIQYFVNVIIKTGMLHLDADIQIPITIGTIPLMPVSTVTVGGTGAIAQTTSDSSTSSSVHPQYETTNSAPDTLNHNNIFHRKEANAIAFMPRYPVYLNYDLPQIPDNFTEENYKECASWNLDILQQHLPQRSAERERRRERCINSAVSVIDLKEKSDETQKF